MPPSSSYFESRRLIVEPGVNPAEGGWPLTWYRIAKGWGMLPEAYWPGDPKYVDGALAGEPANADAIAKLHRLPFYHRLRSESECLFAMVHHLSPSIAIEISKAWHDPPGGVIPTDNGGLPVVSVHNVALVDFDFVLERFVFLNSWGKRWGQGGVGFLPLGFLRQFLVEAWFMPAARIAVPESPNIKMEIREGMALPSGQAWIVDLRDGNTDTLVGWAHATSRSGVFDVEELFIRPEFRRQGHATKIAREILKVSKSHARFFVPWGDHVESNVPGLLAWAAKLKLRLAPSGVRWAGYVATPGEPVSSLPALDWIPEKAKAPRHLLADGAVTDNTDAPEATWDEQRASNRSRLIEKKYREGLTAEETAELEDLQKQAGNHLDEIAPFPFN